MPVASGWWILLAEVLVSRINRLKAQTKPLIADGGMGTLLAEQAVACGLPEAMTPDAILLEAPELVAEIHVEYVSSGADIVLTCTFASSPEQLAKQNLADRLDEIHRTAARAARSAAGEDRFVFGDLGPCGSFFPPMGTLDERTAVASYARRAGALVETGLIDGLLIETQFDLQEVTYAIRGVRSITDLPVAVTMSFDSHGRTMMGVGPADLAQLAISEDVDYVGANCGRSLEETLEAIRIIQGTAPGIALWAKPNAGLPTLLAGQTRYDLSPEAFGQWASRFVDAGVSVFGGCCGTTPDHIRAAAERIRRRA